MEIEKNNSRKNIIILLCAIIVLLVCLFTFYVLTNEKNKKSLNKQQNNSIEENNNNEEKEEPVPEEHKVEDTENDDSWKKELEKKDLSSKCLNCREDIYIVYPEKSDIEPIEKLSLSTDGTNVTLTVNWDLYCENNYFKGCPSGKKDYPITGINQKVKSVYEGGFGQAGDPTLFYLLEDGTIKNNHPSELYELGENLTITSIVDELEAHGPMEKIKDIVEIQTVSVYNEGGTGYVTTIALKEDGTFYDLNPNSLKRIK